MRSYIRVFIVMVLVATNLFALKKDNIKDEMDRKISDILVILQKNDIDFEQKGKKIISIVDSTFDYETMARIALGKEVWSNLDNHKQQEFSKVFEQKLKNSYVDKLRLYNNQEVKILSLDIYNKNRLQLKTKLLGKNGDYDINYNFFEKNGEWYIYDVDLVGVSIVQAYRQQFAGLLKEKSFDEMFEQFKNH